MLRIIPAYYRNGMSNKEIHSYMAIIENELRYSMSTEDRETLEDFYYYWKSFLTDEEHW